MNARSRWCPMCGGGDYLALVLGASALVAAAYAAAAFRLRDAQRFAKAEFR